MAMLSHPVVEDYLRAGILSELPLEIDWKLTGIGLLTRRSEQLSVFAAELAQRLRATAADIDGDVRASAWVRLACLEQVVTRRRGPTKLQPDVHGHGGTGSGGTVEIGGAPFSRDGRTRAVCRLIELIGPSALAICLTHHPLTFRPIAGRRLVVGRCSAGPISLPCGKSAGRPTFRRRPQQLRQRRF